MRICCVSVVGVEGRGIHTEKANRELLKAAVRPRNSCIFQIIKAAHSSNWWSSLGLPLLSDKILAAEADSVVGAVGSVRRGRACLLYTVC